MLYGRNELPKSVADDKHVAISRYMFKFFNHRTEISRLKWHEKFYLFSHMYIMTDDNGKKFDLFQIPEAQEYMFDYLTLIYCGKSSVIDFTRRAFDYYGEIPEATRKKHSEYFWKRLNEWRVELSSAKGIYLGLINVEYQRKLSLWREYRKAKRITAQKLVQKEKYMLAAFHHIYYMVRLYYDEKTDKFDLINVDDFDVVSDIYTYCHVLSRHYFPVMMDEAATLNDDIPILDIKNLPHSLLKLVQSYCKNKALTTDNEYLLFEYTNQKYILWLKYGFVSSAKVNGFQIRSFYFCQERRDLDKFVGKTRVAIDNNLSCYI